MDQDVGEGVGLKAGQTGILRRRFTPLKRSKEPSEGFLGV
jgi:hypothetical protein